MIKNIFLPSQLGDYFVFAERILGIDIGKTHISASQIYVSGRSIIIEKCKDEILENNKKNNDDRIIEALKRIAASFKGPYRVHTALPSSLVVFKELKLPFTSFHKINMVVRFEVEPLLPFSINDAIIDFIITKTFPEKNSTEILIAAVQKQHIEHHLSLFKKAGINPDVITVDMFALYGLYKQIPSYNSLKGTVALADLGSQSTRICSIHNGQLRIIRSLSYGLQSIAKDISNTIDITPQQALEQMIRFGVEQGDPDFKQALKNALTVFWNKIQFALASMGQDAPINKLLLLGGGATMNNITDFVSHHLSISCELFDASLITEDKQVSLKNMPHIPITDNISVATALPFTQTAQFNLRKDEFAVSEGPLLFKQLIAAALLVVIIFAALITHLIRESNQLKKEIRLSEQEAVEEIHRRFPRIPEDEDDLEEVKELAQAELKKEEEMWGAFRTRSSFLEYLLELTSQINKQELGFVPEQIAIIEGPESQITLKARVQDFEALKKLEQALRESKLFSFVEGQSDPDFTMKILIGRRGV